MPSKRYSDIDDPWGSDAYGQSLKNSSKPVYSLKTYLRKQANQKMIDDAQKKLQAQYQKVFTTPPLEDEWQSDPKDFGMEPQVIIREDPEDFSSEGLPSEGAEMTAREKEFLASEADREFENPLGELSAQEKAFIRKQTDQDVAKLNSLETTDSKDFKNESSVITPKGKSQASPEDGVFYSSPQDFMKPGVYEF